MPAQAFPVGLFIAEEMTERGWTADDVLDRMSVEPKDRDLWTLTLALILATAADHTPIVIGQETAEKLGAAFGVSPRFFVALADAYRAWHTAKTEN